jgi:hypothetical protein
VEYDITSINRQATSFHGAAGAGDCCVGVRGRRDIRVLDLGQMVAVYDQNMVATLDDLTGTTAAKR